MADRIPVILDGDPGHDDAIAWMLAVSSPLLDIRAVTSVCGNQTIEKTTYNALRICTLLGLKCPVAKGRPTPMVAEPMTAAAVHGNTGLDGPVLPEPAMEPGTPAAFFNHFRGNNYKVPAVKTALRMESILYESELPRYPEMDRDAAEVQE